MRDNGKRVLIVDDEQDVVRWLSILFREHGYSTDWAYDGHEGFSKAEASPPDLITLDISMPRESGLKMYDNLLKSDETASTPRLPQDHENTSRFSRETDRQGRADQQS